MSKTTVITLERLKEQRKRKKEDAFYSIHELVEQASEAIAPLWPISTFIARHPWMELEHMPFIEVAEHFQQSQKVNLFPTMPVVKKALAKGEIHSSFVEKKLKNWLSGQYLLVHRNKAEQLCHALLWNDSVPYEWLDSPELHTLAAEITELIGSLHSKVEKPISVHIKQLGERLDQQMIKWCKLYLDEKQAAWAMPLREQGFYSAWQQLVKNDPALSKRERKRLADWPKDAKEALLHSLSLLNIDDKKMKDYLESHLLALPGWAGMLKWRSKQTGEGVQLLVDYLAIRLSLEWVFAAPYLPLDQKKMTDPSSILPLLAAWIHWGGMSVDEWRQLPVYEMKFRLVFADRFWRINRHHLWLEAWEETYESQLKEKIASRPNVGQPERTAVQLLFCIDVRSEPFRRYLEESGPFETYGCAGFFGLPIRTRELDSHYTHPSCPVIVEPQHEIYESSAQDRVAEYRRRLNVFQFIGDTFKNMKKHALASLLLPEMSGPWLGLHTIARSAAPGWAGHVIQHAEKTAERKPPTKLSLHHEESSSKSGLSIGLTTDEQVQYVKQLLTNIGLTSSFAPLVVVCGHESTTTNNPYASSLDCGACGGTAGAFNARVFASLCNLKEVRKGLEKEGIVIPDETVFVAAEHITTVDELYFLDMPTLSKAAEQSLNLLESKLKEVSRKANAERLKKLPHTGKYKNPIKEANRRSVDWSEIRPEWGLAGNAAFFIGRRSLTKHCQLDGKVFLHSYDWRKDYSGEALENIVSGPATVGQWINLQYYASTVAPHYYGSGSKTTQTVTGGLGVMQGNGSDLLSGLPWQSVASSDWELFHSPLRLLLIIEAPHFYIERLLQHNPLFRQKVKNGWLRLSSIEPDTRKWIKWDPSMI
ncbi:DUF2309 domain-containing protein [Bacillus alveayuensis]|uniref:DUF2309 domain-containing protein n=1 Tax=Aeribacillus alveayuensis TaxID=279215 RepID=UPI0005D0F6C3|nr:DUF2309 domain-containing protein [Bacillus alveayuensis]